MKKPYPLIIIITAILGLTVAWLINMDIIFSEPTQRTPSQFDSDLNECINISEKSVAHLKAVVEFQQLEITGRKARVMRLCMSDHAYKQNPAWTKQIMPIAEEQAIARGISTDEAFEDLRREYMVKPATHTATPYWIPAKQE